MIVGVSDAEISRLRGERWMTFELTQRDVEMILQEQHNYFYTGATKSLAFRIEQLKALKAAMQKYEQQLTAALKQDLGKHENESYMTEIGYVYHSITETMKKLKKWAKPKRLSTPIILMPSKSYMLYEPYGAVLIIGPYNYPLQLLMEPLIGVIAAGNTAVLKPSEMATNVSAVVKRMIDETFDGKFVTCVEGSIPTNTALIHSKFDYIFFTGSIPVGKVVMEAAAKNLVPVTLELGGKSPVIVDETANIREAARRIMWGKTINAGQTCVAPDFVVVHEQVKDELVKEMKEALRAYYGEDIEKSSSFGRIINNKHFRRITSLIEQDREGILFGGRTNEHTYYIEPTLIEVSSWHAAVMREEIFGPVLPIMTYTNLDTVIREIRELSKPLALYLFTRRKEAERRVLSQLSAGNACINDTISHLVNPNIPFGGVGSSGMGAYHGHQSFLTFSHAKGVLRRSPDRASTLAYPTYTKKQLSLIKKFLK